MKVKTDSEIILSNDERTYKSKSRFRSPYDLWQRYDDTKNKSKDKSVEREKIINLYQRKPYKMRRGGKIYYEPNWGIYTDSVDDYIRFFSAIALDRKIWCRIETYIGVEEQLDTLYSDQITNAFHKHCINRWYCKEEDIISAIHDDCFFNKGCLVWRSPLETYPVHIPTEYVFPDTNATTETKSFDLLFIEDKLSAVELYERATDPAHKDLGWNKSAILRALSNNIDSLKDCDNRSVIEEFRRGGISQADQDKLISIVYCYVKEYNEFEGDVKEKKGNRISLMVVPKDLISMGIVLDSVTEKPSKNLKRSDYLQYVDYIYKDFGQVISLWTSNIKRAYYNSASFANQIYTSCKFHDLTTNTLIRAIKRNMRLYMKTGSQDTRKRIETIDPDAEVMLLNQDDSLEQITLRQDISAVGELLRNMRAGISTFSPTDFQGTQASPKGYPITKAETNVLANQLDDSKSLAIKLIISKNRELCCELYRRFINSTEDSDTWEGFKRFKAEMKRLKVPDEAWEKDNVDIYPRFNQFAGRASSNYATASALLQATQVKPSSKGEAKAKRDVIASLVNESNVVDYEDTELQFDKELFIIGQENAALDDPLTSPSNVPVTGTDNHMLHIQGHLQDYMAKLEFGNKLLQMAAQDPTYRKTFFLERAADMVNAQDNKGAHITAHIAVVSKDETKLDDLKQLEGTFAQAQAQQDALASKVQSLQQQFAQADAQSNIKDQEFMHRQRMDELEFQKTKAMNQLDMEKKVSQIQTTQQNNEAKQEQKIVHKEQEQTIKTQDRAADVVTKAEKNRLDIEKKRIENAMKQQEANQKANEKAQKTTSNSTGS